MSCSSTSNVRFQLRRATEAQWIATDPTLLLGEPAFSTDKLQLKIGNGSAWSETQYINLAGGVGPVGTPTTLQSLIVISGATKTGTSITIGSARTLLKNQAVSFPTDINAGIGSRDIVANQIYYVFASVTDSTNFEVSETIDGSAY